MNRGPTRRQLVTALTAAVAAVGSGAVAVPASAVSVGPVDTVATLEAFADTMVPGQKRYVGDRAIAGAVQGPGAVQAGAIALLELPELGVGPLLPALATLVDIAATAYAVRKGLVLLPTQPPFVALDFSDRTALASELLNPGEAEQRVYVLLALFSAVAFDTAAHLHTTQALAQRHPGLAWLRFPAPDADGFWRFPTYSYGTQLGTEHPQTTAGGSPA